MKLLDNKIFFGIVEDNKDPNRRGRVKVRVQSVFDDIPLEDIPYASPTGSIDGKTFNVPAIGKVVIVAFAWGDQYQPYYTYSNYFNINLQNKLESLSDDEYAGFSAIVFDHQTQMFIDSKKFTLDFQFNKFTMTDSDMNLELKDNKGKITIGSLEADQNALMTIHWFDWFDKVVDELIKPSSLIGNSGNPVLKPKFDSLLAEYKVIKNTFLSNNVFVVDNDKVKKLDRDIKTDVTTNDPNIKANNDDIKNVDDGQITKNLNDSITTENEKSASAVSNSVPENSNYGYDIPDNNVVVLYESSTGSPAESQVYLSNADYALSKIQQDNSNGFQYDDSQNPDDLLSGDVTQTGEIDYTETISEEFVIQDDGFSYIDDPTISENSGTNLTLGTGTNLTLGEKAANTFKPDMGDFFIKTNLGTFIVNQLYGLAGIYLMQFMKDLQDYLSGTIGKNGPKRVPGFIGLASNGITRSIELTKKGGKNKSSSSKHGAGLAIDLLIDTISVNTAAKIPLTSKGYPNGGYNKLKYLAANKILSQDPNLRLYIDSFVKTYPGNTKKSFSIVWGGNFRGELAVSEFHHFEISDQSMAQFFTPYIEKLKIANIAVPKKQSDLAAIYNMT